MDNNTISIITNLIGSLGFPIVSCFFLWKFINETMKEFTRSITENTKTLNKLCDKLDVESVRVVNDE